MNHSSFDSIYLTSTDILSSPIFSRNAWQLHLDYLRQYGDQPTNDARDRDTFKDLGRTAVSQDLIQTCRKIHVMYGTTLPDILEDLSRPLNQINDPTISPQVTLDRLKLVLSELRRFEKQANTLLGELSDVCYSNNVSKESLNVFLSSIERPIMSAIIKYWSNSCKEKIADLEESMNPRNYRKLETVSPVTPPRPSNLVPTFSSSPILPLGFSPPMNSPPKRLGIDLAKAKVPRFTGRKDEFPMFFALLNEVLDYNKDYPETTRIGFLVSNLSGEPLTSIQSIPIRAGSLAIMLKSLRDRYGDSEDQVDRLIKILKDKRLSVPRTHQELTSWYYQLRDMSVCLLSSTSEAQERLFLSCLFDSLPFNIHESIVASFDRSGQKATVKNVINELGVIVRTREKLLFRAGDVSDRRETCEFLNHSNSQSRALFNSASPDTRSFPQSRSDNNSLRNPSLTPYSCAFCSQSHDSASCQIVQDFDSRQRIVRENRLCLLCLQRGHIVGQCSHSRCSNCNGRHHVSLCGKLFPPSESNANSHPETPVSSVNPTSNPALSPFPRSNPVESVTPEIPMRSFRLNGHQEIPQLPFPIVSAPIVSPIVLQPVVSSIVSHPIVSPIVSSVVSSPIVSDPIASCPLVSSIVTHSIVSSIVSPCVVSSPIASCPLVSSSIVTPPIVSGSRNSAIVSVKSSSIPQDSSLNIGNPSDLVMFPHVSHRKWCRKKIVDRGQVLPLVNIGSSNLPQPHSPYDAPSETLYSSTSRSGCNFLLNQIPMEQRTRCKLKFLNLQEPSHGQPFEDEYPDSLMTCSCPDVPNPNPPATEEPKGCQPMVKERRGKVGMLATSLKPPILSHEFA